MRRHADLGLALCQDCLRRVLRLGKILEEYGTYESNGIAISDVNEIWWLETIGGHHWMARRVPDDAYVTNPNQLGSDYFDLAIQMSFSVTQILNILSQSTI